MAKKPEFKMSMEDRAKQFAPFSALRGLELALLKKEKEKMKTARKVVADDKQEEINRILTELETYDTVEVTYFNRGEYVKKAGCVQKVSKDKKMLKIDELSIYFKDIIEIKGV